MPKSLQDLINESGQFAIVYNDEDVKLLRAPASQPKAGTLVCTVAALPTNVAIGTLAAVTDAAFPFTPGLTPTGGGVFTELVWFNGTEWHIVTT